jgi:hypothetical protein
VGIDVYVAPFGDALAEMTVAQLNLAASVDHLVPVGEKFDWRLWRERWKRLPGSHDPSWLDFMRGGRHPTRLELRRAAQKLQRDLSSKLELAVKWDEDAPVPTGQEHDLSDRLPRTGCLGLRRLAIRWGHGDAPNRRQIDEALSEKDDAEELSAHEAMRDPAHPFVELLHLEADNLFVPADLGAVLQGIPWTIGSAPRLVRELEKVETIIGPVEAARSSDDLLFDVVRTMRTLERLARRSVELRLPMFVDG